jgi:predicted ATPase
MFAASASTWSDLSQLQAASDATSPADLARVPAVRLFVERVRDVRPDFRLTPANGPTVAAICRRLDALPLALELAAPWVKVLALEDLLNRLEHESLPGTVSVRDLPERQQTMNATVAWSYQLLGPEEQGRLPLPGHPAWSFLNRRGEGRPRGR